MFEVRVFKRMNHYYKLKASIFLVSCLITNQVNAEGVTPNSFTEMPKTCQQIAPETLIYDLPLSINKLTPEQHKNIKTIIDEARMQACILQMQYDGLVQQVIAVLFEGNDVTEEQLKPFYNRLASLSQNRIENKFKTILSIRKILTDKEWQDLRLAYARDTSVKSNFIKQQIELQQSYDALISGNNPSEFTTLPLMPQSLCIEINPKIRMIEQAISTLQLNNTQEGHFRNILRQQEGQSCTVKLDIPKFVEQLLQLVVRQPDGIQNKQYQAIFNQLVSKEYLQEMYQMQSLSSLFGILTPEQKTQLREKYMVLKGVL